MKITINITFNCMKCGSLLKESNKQAKRFYCQECNYSVRINSYGMNIDQYI